MSPSANCSMSPPVDRLHGLASAAYYRVGPDMQGREAA